MASSQLLRKGQIPTCCKLCETETKISWKCLNCDILMCNRCKDRRHSTLRNARTHKVVDIKEVGGQHTAELDFSNILCKEHTGQVCCLFCKSCRLLVCPLCIAKVHNGHDLVEISEGFQIQIQRLKDGQKQMKVKTDKLAMEESKLKEIKKAENAKYMEAKREIQAHNKSLKRAIDKYSKNLLKDLDQKWEILKTSIEKEETNVSTSKEKKTDRKMDIEDIIDSNEPEQIFEMSSQLEKAMIETEEPLELNFTPMPTFVPADFSEINVGFLKDTLTKIELKVIKEYTTNISKVLFLSSCADSLWISNQEVLQEVQPEINNLEDISSFDFDNQPINGMAVTPNNDLLLALKGNSELKQISGHTNKLMDTNYRVDNLLLTAVHVTRDYQVVVGARNFGEPFQATGRRLIISMDKEGEHKTVYENDRNNQRIFTYPRNISCARNGSICVIDRFSYDYTGRVVILQPQKGGILNIYNGHPDINAEDPFKPVSIATTPLDNIIVTDSNAGILHILNNVGDLMTHIGTWDSEIQNPYSLAFTTTGKFYIGCSSIFEDAKMYEVQLSGC